MRQACPREDVGGSNLACLDFLEMDARPFVFEAHPRELRRNARECKFLVCLGLCLGA
jgi:hypothetical protein